MANFLSSCLLHLLIILFVLVLYRYPCHESSPRICLGYSHMEDLVLGLIVEFIAFLRQPVELYHDPAVDCVGIGFYLFIKEFKEILKVCIAGNKVSVVPCRSHFLGCYGVVLVIDISDDLLDDIFKRDKTGRSAVLIDAL